MIYQLHIRESIQSEVKRIAKEIIDAAITDSTSDKLTNHEKIHSVRKLCKRIRALLRIVRPNLGSTYRNENIFFRDLARTLSDERDRQVLIESLILQTKHPNNQDIIKNLNLIIEKLKKEDGKIDSSELIQEFSEGISESILRIIKWEIKNDGFSALKGGIKKTYSRGKKAMQVAHTSPTPENYHEWRKKVKYHYYHLELLTQIWPAVMDTYVEQAHRLSEMLGNDHDFCLLKDNILSNNKLNIGKDVQSQILSTIDTEQMNLRQKIKPLGQKVYAELPKHLLIRLEGYWNSNILHQIN